MIDKDRYYILIGKHFVEYLRLKHWYSTQPDEVEILKQLNKRLTLVIDKMYKEIHNGNANQTDSN